MKELKVEEDVSKINPTDPLILAKQANIKGSVGYRNPDVHIGIEIRMSTALSTKIIIN